MPRVPLGSIDGNSWRGKELTPYIHRKIDGKHESDFKPAEITHDLEISYTIIQYTLDLSSQRDNRKSVMTWTA